MIIYQFYKNNKNGRIISKSVYDKLKKPIKEKEYTKIKKDLDIQYAMYLQDSNTRFLINVNNSEDVVTLEQFLELSTFQQEKYRIATDCENKDIKETISLTPFLDNAIKLRTALYGKDKPINNKYFNFYLDKLPSSGLTPILD